METPFSYINDEKINLNRQDHRDEIIRRNKVLSAAIKNGIESGVKIDIEITTSLACLKCGTHLQETSYNIELDDCIENNIPSLRCNSCNTRYSYHDTDGRYYPIIINKTSKIKIVK